MKEGEDAIIYEVDIEGMTDSDTFIPVHSALLGFSEHSSSRATSFVIVFRDESQLQFQMKQSQEVKARSEELLSSIFPGDIGARVKQGEQNISFSVETVSILFIDIAKFSEYSSTFITLANYGISFTRFF
jgi:hypothetical protein